MWLATLNCKGLRLQNKLDMLHSLIERECLDILFLQETHVDNLKCGKSIERKIGANIFWSFGTTQARGVGVYFKTTLDFHLHKFVSDPFGRFIVIDAKIDDKEFRIINVYAPNNAAERKEFYIELYPHFVTPKAIIFGGDLNCLKDPSIDKINGNPNNGTSGWNEISILLRDSHLVDVYRYKYPRKPTVSWSDGSMACLLDRIFISNNLANKIEDVSFVPISFSDHDMLKFKLLPLPPSVDVGKGYWKFNNSLLKDQDFLGKIRSHISAALEEIDDTNDPLLWWDQLKVSFKMIAIKHSKFLAREKNKMYAALTAQYILAEKLGKVDNMQRVKNKLKELDLKKLEGSKIRSRVALLDNKEQPSKFFYQKEMSKGQKKLISKIIKEDDTVCEDNNSITQSFVEYYSSLYKKEPGNLPPRHYLENLPKVDKEKNEHLGKLIEVEEIETALKQMENNKAPGSDGLTKEFFQAFSKELIPIIKDIFTTIYDQESLCQSQRLSYISLLCKNNNEPQFCKNYRPISLLNVDYKILSKVLCNRLRPLLNDIIHPDQTCSIPGRSIFDNCHLIRDLINDINSNENGTGILLSTDQEKAFDRIDHSYISIILKTFGFKYTFIRWVNILYNNIFSSIIVNNHISTSFPVQRSVRQGCPLSPLIYVLCLEPVLQRIRDSPDVKGLQVPGILTPCKLTAYADDCKFFIKDHDSAKKIIEHFNNFGNFSGSKLSLDKCEAMFLGRWRVRRDTPLNIKWVTQMTIFGIKFGELSEDDIWHPLYKKIENVLNLFKTRHLSFYGKAKLINVMVLSKLWYLTTVIPLSKHYERLITKLVFSFIWGKIESIRRKTMYLPCKQGGIGLVNISLKAQSLMLNQVMKVFLDRKCTWVNYGHTYLGIALHRFPGYSFLNNRPHCIEDPPTYYKICLDYIRKIVTKDENFVFKPGLTSKTFYTLLLKLENTTVHCVSTFPLIDFKTVFSNLCHKTIDTFTINTSFKLVHDIIPVAYKLYTWNFRNILPFCRNCSPKQIHETVTHCFWECPVIQPARHWLERTLMSICDLNLSCEIVRFGNFSDSISRPDLAIYLLTEFRYAVWITRCRVRLDNVRPAAEAVLKFMHARINNRIIVDKSRLSPPEFMEQWVLPGFVHFNNKGHLVITLML